MSQDHVRASWAKESEQFKASVEEEGSEMHRHELEKWKAAAKFPRLVRRNITKKSDRKIRAMETLNKVGIPMADALSERLGAHVVILVVGPVGSENGEVCLRIVFSDTAKLQTTRTWAQFDHKGFTEMENSIMRYGREAFTKVECRARAWPPPESAEPVHVAGLLTLTDTSAPAPVPTPRGPTQPLPAAPAPVVLAPVIPAPIVPAPVIPTPVVPTPVVPVLPVISVPPIVPALIPVADDGIDRSGWTENLKETHAYLSQKQWGPGWSALVDALVQHEWSFYHVKEDGKLPKLRTRPPEYADWMKEHRLVKDYAIRPEFGTDLFEWWKDLCPPLRLDGAGVGEGDKDPPRQHTRENGWLRLHYRCQNGPIPLVLGLAWWGQSICNAAATDGLGAEEVALADNKLWQLIIADVEWVLVHVLTQLRLAMEEWTAKRDAEAAEEAAEKAAAEEAKAAEAEAWKGEKGPAVRAKKSGAKVKAKKAEKLTTGKKRKHPAEDGGELTPPKKPTPERPKPRPMTRGVRACGEVRNPSGMEKSAQTASPSPSQDESTVASTATPSQSTVLTPVDKDKEPGDKASGATTDAAS
ncbi:hypothetical protein K438DRAFT_2075417 [Mycena galopus ATCC 62051]|nr:hypothetical protein K438DRAFT_2075417 [Mycena galopus ATCC 62051]